MFRNWERTSVFSLLTSSFPNDSFVDWVQPNKIAGLLRFARKDGWLCLQGLEIKHNERPRLCEEGWNPTKQSSEICLMIKRAGLLRFARNDAVLRSQRRGIIINIHCHAEQADQRMKAEAYLFKARRVSASCQFGV